eukprot:2273283-Rhodomonas_salina.1
MRRIELQLTMLSPRPPLLASRTPASRDGSSGTKPPSKTSRLILSGQTRTSPTRSSNRAGGLMALPGTSPQGPSTFLNSREHGMMATAFNEQRRGKRNSIGWQSRLSTTAQHGAPRYGVSTMARSPSFSACGDQSSTRRYARTCWHLT